MPAERKVQMNKKFWNWQNDGEERTLYLNGTIASEPWLDDDITPALFKEELLSGTGPITIWLNSPGGDCVAASQIYTLLMDYKNDVTVKIDGIAASAASVIAMAGTKVLMSPTSLMMIHNPATIAMGDHREMEKAAEVLDAVKDSIINAYEIKTNLSRKDLSKMMDAETWFDATKAVELGFADGILERETQPATVNMSPFVFSQKAVDAALMNKLAEKESALTENVSKQTVKEAALTEKTPVQIPIDTLYKRLEQLR